MSAKCAICKRAFVSAPGQICITCKMRQQNNQMQQSSSQHTPAAPIPAGSSGIRPENTSPMEEPIQKSAGYAAGKNGFYTGIVQNVHKEEIGRGILRRWFQSLIYGTLLVFSDTQYEFSLYLEGNYTAEQIQGKEVIFYGDPGYCFLSNNGTVQVRGKTDRNGVLIAEEICGVNTSFRMRPKFAIPGILVRLLSLAILIGVIAAVVYFSTMEREPVVDTPSTGRLLFAAAGLACAGLVVKLRVPKRFLIAAILAAVGLLFVEPVISGVIFAVLLLWRIIRRK